LFLTFKLKKISTPGINFLTITTTSIFLQQLFFLLIIVTTTCYKNSIKHFFILPCIFLIGYFKLSTYIYLLHELFVKGSTQPKNIYSIFFFSKLVGFFIFFYLLFLHTSSCGGTYSILGDNFVEKISLRTMFVHTSALLFSVSFCFCSYYLHVSIHQHNSNKKYKI